MDQTNNQKSIKGHDNEQFFCQWIKLDQIMNQLEMDQIRIMGRIMDQIWQIMDQIIAQIMGELPAYFASHCGLWTGRLTTLSLSPAGQQRICSPKLNFATKKLSTGTNGEKEDATSLFYPQRFNRAIMVPQWYDLRLETRETPVRTLPWAKSGHVTTPQRLCSPMLILK